MGMHWAGGPAKWPIAAVWAVGLAVAVAVVVVAGGLPGGAGVPSDRGALTDERRGPPAVERFVVGDDLRRALVSRPVGVGRRPVVIALHGSGGSAHEFARETGLADLLPDAVVVFPFARYQTWNAGDCCLGAQDHAVDDLGFVRTVIETLVVDGSADPARVHVVGFSNGGMLAHAFGCRHPDLVAGIAAMSGSITSPCGDDRPPRVLVVHGTADPLIGIGGFSGVTSTGRPFAYQSLEEVTAGYVDALACEADIVSRTRPSIASTTWRCGRSGPALRTVIVDGGGHGWPGNRVLSYGFDLDASVELAEFFGLQIRDR